MASDFGIIAALFALLYVATFYALCRRPPSYFPKTVFCLRPLRGFAPRQAQTDMAVAIETAIKQKSSLIVEAGTGTGKTFAYLAPALQSDKKTIVSTGTKNLQEQLFHRDLPLVKKALASNRKTALLKGRANYLCLHRLRQHGGNSALVETGQRWRS